MGAAAVMLTVVLFVAVSKDDTASAGVEIHVVDGRLQVALTDVETRAEFVENAVADAGLDISVTSEPVGPSIVGRFVSAGGQDSTVIDHLDERGDRSFIGFSVPLHWPGHVDVVLGRAAKRGEDYVALSDAYAAGEPLSCTGIYGQTAAAAAAQLEQLGLDAAFQPFVDGRAQPLVDVRAIDAAAEREWSVSDAVALSPKRVVLTITADGIAPAEQPVNTDRGACHE
jgi:hypothetical protein